MKAVYPILLTPAEHGYVVYVPDLKINTEGDTLPQAIAMARDAIGIWCAAEEAAGRAVPAPSGGMPAAAPGEIAASVEVDFDFLRSRPLRDG